MVQQKLEQMAKAAETSPIKYNPINPGANYDRKKFVSAQKQLNDLEKYTHKILENPNDIDARQDLSALLYGDPAFHVGQSPEFMQTSAKQSYTSGIDNMAAFAKRHRDELFSVVDGKGMFGLAMSVQLYKTGHKDHDYIIDIVNKVRTMNMAAQKQEIEQMREVVLEGADSRDMPDWAKTVLIYFSGSDQFVASAFRRRRDDTVRLMNSLLLNGKVPDRKRIRRLIEDSMDKAEDEFQKETDEEARSDIWQHNIRPLYVTLAKAAYSPEKKEEDAKSKEKTGKKEREKRRQELRMAA